MLDLIHSQGVTHTFISDTRYLFLQKQPGIFFFLIDKPFTQYKEGTIIIPFTDEDTLRPLIIFNNWD